jgi:hypothetical protein
LLCRVQDGLYVSAHKVEYFLRSSGLVSAVVNLASKQRRKPNEALFRRAAETGMLLPARGRGSCDAI